MSSIRVYKQRYTLLLVGLLACAIVIRLLNISSLPPFVDENANILVGISTDYRDEIDPVGQGRPLLTYQFTLPAQLEKLLTGQYSVLGPRIFASFIGICGLVLFYILFWHLFGMSTALIFLAIGTFIPLFWIHDRLALQDTFFGIFYGAAFLSLYQAGTYNSDRTKARLLYFLFGLCIGLATINKVTAILSFPWLVAISVLIRNLQKRKILERAMLFGLLGFFIPWLPFLFELNGYARHLMAFHHVPFLAIDPSTGIFQSFTGMLQNINSSFLKYFYFLYQYGGVPFVVLTILCIYHSMRHVPELNLLRIATFISWLVCVIVYSTRSYARYFYPEMYPLLGLFSYSIYCVMPGSPRVRECTVILVWLIRVSFVTSFCWWILAWISVQKSPYVNLINPANPFFVDYLQYSTAWPGGFGITAIIKYVEQDAAQHSGRTQVWCYNHNVAGCRALALHFLEDPKVEIVQVPFAKEHEPENIARRLSLGGCDKSQCKANILVLSELFGTGNEFATHLSSLGLVARHELKSARFHEEPFNLFRIERYDSTILKGKLSARELVIGQPVAPRSKFNLDLPPNLSAWSISGEVPNTIQLPMILELKQGNLSVSKNIKQSKFCVTIPTQDGFTSGNIELFVSDWNLVLDASDLENPYLSTFKGESIIVEDMQYNPCPK